MDIERIRRAMTLKGINQSELARRTGVTQGAIQQILSGKSQSSRTLPSIARELGVSVHWLAGETSDPTADANVLDEMGVTRIREIKVGYAMGAGSFIDDADIETTWANFDTRWLAHLTRSSPELLFVAHGVGDSMMPTLLNNDTIIVDRGFRKFDRQDAVWALTYGELGMVKRVRGLPGGRALIMSDNPAVSDFEVALDELHVLGRVIWVGRSI